MEPRHATTKTYVTQVLSMAPRRAWSVSQPRVSYRQKLLCPRLLSSRSLYPGFTSASPTPRTSSASRGVVPVAANSNDADDVLMKYGLGSDGSPIRASASKQVRGNAGKADAPNGMGNGVLLLILANLALFLADHYLHLSIIKSLYLHHAHPRWFQFATSLFCHANWSHLSGNIFLLYVFGKVVEEEEGAFGVIASYLICGIGASIASYMLIPAQTSSVGLLGLKTATQVVGLGASGAVFGLFAVSVLVKARNFSLRSLLESVILGQFVVQKVMSEVRMQVAAAGSLAASGGINHIAHLGGAMMGVLLIWLISCIPGDDAKE